VENVVNENVYVENVVNENVYVGNVDVNVVNLDNVEDEDYGVNESNMNVDHMVNESNMHVNDEDVNNADVNNVREDVHEKPEKRAAVDDSNPEGKHDDKKTVEKQVYEKYEKRDGASSSSLTYYNRQSSTKTEAVARYVEFPFLKHFMQLVTPLSNSETGEA
jgi:hypothetical protein